MSIIPSFKKSLIVEQFQGNYLKLFLKSQNRIKTDNRQMIKLHGKQLQKVAV